MNLFPILLAKLGISIKSEVDKLKFGLFTMFPCGQPAFKKAVAVPREATRAQKSACPPITSSRASTSPSIYSNVLGRFSAEGVNFAELAPTEWNTSFSRCTHRLPKFRHFSWRSFNDFCKFEFSRSQSWDLFQGSSFLAQIFLTFWVIHSLNCHFRLGPQPRSLP